MNEHVTLQWLVLDLLLRGVGNEILGNKASKEACHEDSSLIIPMNLMVSLLKLPQDIYFSCTGEYEGNLPFWGIQVLISSNQLTIV